MTDERADLTALYLDYDYLEEGLDTHRLSLTETLAGKKLELYLEDNTKLFIDFQSASQLEWRKLNESPKLEQYQAIAVRPDIFFVDWVYHEDPNQSMSLAVDLVAQEATLVWSILPNPEDAIPNLNERIRKDNDLSAVKVRISYAGIGGERSQKVHQTTQELVGKRIKYTYSNQHTYEHIYLNESLFTWHCLAGEGKGSSETNPVDYIKLGEELYLFVWREVIAAWVGIIVIDLSQNRTAGKTFWTKPQVNKIFNLTVGAYAQLLNEIKYE
ncbi:MAG: phenolic acid decarboxylase [Nostoc sp.]